MKTCSELLDNSAKRFDTTFFEFWNSHLTSNQVYFCKFNYRKSEISVHVCTAVQQSFNFQKITGTLKLNILFWKFAQTFCIHQRTISKIKYKFVKYFILFSKDGQNGFQKPCAKWIANIMKWNSGIEVLQSFGTTNKV